MTTLLLAILLVQVAHEGEAQRACAAGAAPTARLFVRDQEKAETIEWAKDLDEAMKLSAKDGRPVLTYWTFDT